MQVHSSSRSFWKAVAHDGLHGKLFVHVHRLDLDPMMTKLSATIISIKMPLKLPQHRERSVGSSSGQVTYILFGLNGGSDFTAGRDMLRNHLCKD